MRPDDAIELFNRCRGHCLERQNYIEDLQNGPIRKDRNSSVSRPSAREYSTYRMEPVHTTNKAVNQGPSNNIHWTQGYPTPPRHFHTQTRDSQQSVRKFSQNQYVYQRGHNHPPGPPGEDYSRRTYSWNVKPNASRVVQNNRRYPGSYYGLSYQSYCGWTEWHKPILKICLETAEQKTAGVTFYKIRSNEVYKSILFLPYVFKLKQNLYWYLTLCW